MTHDFANKPKATKKKKKTTARKTQIPGWVWLFTGIVTGVFISFLGYLADLTPDRAPATKAEIVEADDSSKPNNSTRTKFDFYTLLPEREVIVPDNHDTQPQAPTQATIYILQAGSFRSAADADRLRANLILMGLDAKVEAVTNNNDTWHRVQVGPFTDRSQLSKARSSLISNGIETLLLKRKADA